MRWWLLFITPFVFASEVLIPGAAFYRFSDDAGNRVLADKIPPRYVKHGYEVLDHRLFVIHRVAPAPTAEELAAMERAQRQAQIDAQKQAQDDALLDRFPSVSDVEAAKRSELGRLELQLEIQMSAVESHRKNLAALKRKAAREERNGQVSEQTLSEVAQKELDLLRAQQILLEREQRVADLEALYQARKTRVAELTQTEL